MTGISHFVRFFIAALFAASLVYGDLYLKAFDGLRGGMSLVLVPFRAAAELPAATRDRFNAYAGAREALLAERRALEQQILQDSIRLKSFDFYVRQNAELRRALELRERRRGRWLVAETSGNIAYAAGRRILLDKGLDDGVTPGLAVVDENGVAGQILRVDRDTSIVGLFTAPGQWVASRVARNNLLVILRGDGSNELVMEYVASDADIELGDELVADGGLYPPGYPLGVVRSLERGSVYYDGSVEPHARLGESPFAMIYFSAGDDDAAGDGNNDNAAGDNAATSSTAAPPSSSPPETSPPAQN